MITQPDDERLAATAQDHVAATVDELDRLQRCRWRVLRRAWMPDGQATLTVRSAIAAASSAPGTASTSIVASPLAAGHSR